MGAAAIQLALDLEPTLDYELIVSKRARRATLRVSPGRGLVVTIPRWFARRDIPEFVESHREWALAALDDLHQRTPACYRSWPPRCLQLQAMEREITVSYREPGSEHPAVCWNNDTHLELCVASHDKVQVASAIAAAVKPLARQFLEPRLRHFVELHDLHYRRLVIRGQRSVWGSYSSSGTLSLNYKLVFLQPALVDYVLLHELAHTRHLDHSKGFWSLLQSFDDNALDLDAQLRDVETDVPPWLELAR